MAVAATLLFLPGIGLSYALGVRGTTSAVVAPALSVAIIAVGAIATTAVGVAWNWVSFTASALLLIALAAVARGAVQRGSGQRLSLGITIKPGPLVLGVGLSAIALITWAVIFLPQATLFAQTFDNTFHLNAIRYILDTGRASSFTIREVTGGSGLYPAAWHALVALVAMPAGLMLSPAAMIPVAVNATTIAVIVGGWAMGVLAVAQVIAGRSGMVAIMAAAVISATPLFPWLFIEWGSLYPNLLGMSLVPSVVAIMWAVGRTAPSTAADHRAVLTGDNPRWVALIVIAVAVVGVTLSHPNAAFTLACVALMIAFGAFTRRVRAAGLPIRPSFAAGGIALVLAAGALVWAWVYLAPPLPTTPPSPIGMRVALTEWALSAPVKDSPEMWAWPALLALGVVVGVKRRESTPLVLALVGMVVFVGAATAKTAELSRAFGGVFYQDPRRIAVFSLILALPLALSALGLYDDLMANRATPSGRRWWVARASVVAVACVAIAVPTWTLSMGPHISTLATKIAIPSPKRYLSPDEMALIERLPADVSPGTKVVGDPGNGSAFIYALSDVPVVFPHFFTDDSPAMSQLRNHLFDPATRPASCDAVRSTGAWYFADFGRGSTFFGGRQYYPGLVKPDYTMLTLVDEQGDAKLYRITGCK